MAASTTLTRLLSELKAVRSPLDRMRVVARAWRSLRSMRPEERRLLAGQVGMEGAEELLEGLGRGEKRLAPVLVLRALEKAKKADPSQLRGLVSGLKDKDKRGTILQKWLDSVADGLDDQEEEPAKSPAQVVPEPVPVPVPPAQPVEPSSAPSTQEPSRSIPVAKPAPAIPVGSPLPKPVAKPEPKGKPATPAPPRARPRRVPPAVPLPIPVPVPRAKPAGVGTKPAPSVAPQPAAAVPAGEQLADGLHRIDGLMARFRLLRSGLESNGRSGVGDVAHLLGAFPAGWARRRALAALLRRRIPADLDHALALIDEQESPLARRWCIGTVLEHWTLSAEQQDRLRRRRRSGS